MTPTPSRDRRIFDTLPLIPDGIRIRADLLPPTVWGSNVRALALTTNPRTWDRLRIPVCEAANNLCEACHRPAPGRRRPDCLEQWAFDVHGPVPVQRLRRLVALCPDCHNTQHIGRAQNIGILDDVRDTLQRVNGWGPAQVEADIARAWARFNAISTVAFALDLSVLADRLSWPGRPDLYWTAEQRAELGSTYEG